MHASSIPSISTILDTVLGTSPALVSWHVRRAVMITRDLVVRSTGGDDGAALRPPALDDLYAAVRAPDPMVIQRTRDG